MRRLAIASIALAGCAAIRPAISPIVDRDREYAVLYHELEQCSGIQGDFRRVTFYVSTEHTHNGRTFDGYYELESRSIVLRKPYEREAVAHEIMHNLTGSNTHPAKYFNGVCGDLTRGEVF